MHSSSCVRPSKRYGIIIPMNAPRFEQQTKTETPEQELSRIREVASKHVETSRESGIEISPRTATHEVVKAYADTITSEVLHPNYALEHKEVEAITLQLSPERQLLHVIFKTKVLIE